MPKQLKLDQLTTAGLDRRFTKQKDTEENGHYSVYDFHNARVSACTVGHWGCTAADQLPAPWTCRLASSCRSPLHLHPCSPCSQTPLFSFQNYVNGESLEGEDVVVWAMIGAQHVPRSEDSPLITNMGALACCAVLWQGGACLGVHCGSAEDCYHGAQLWALLVLCAVC